MLVITRGYMLLNAVLGAEICRDHIIDLLVDYGLDIDATHHGLSMVVPYPPLGESYHLQIRIEIMLPYGYGSIPIHTIFRGMNIHLPAILMFTRGTRSWHTAMFESKSFWPFLVPKCTGESYIPHQNGLVSPLLSPISQLSDKYIYI